MNHSAAHLLIEILADDWNVQTIFGIPGAGISGLMEALRVHQDRIQFIQTRHEEAAALMASSYAKFTGKLGVCIASTGAGGIHLLNGLYDAKLDGAPVLAITGMVDHNLINTFSPQDICLDRLFEDVAIYNARVMGADHVETVLQLACKTALSRGGVSHLTFPVDFQVLPSKRRNGGHKSAFLSTGSKETLSNYARTEDLEAAADLLNTGRKIAILIGQGAAGASHDLIEIAEALGAPIVKTLLGKGIIPDDSVYSMGCLGLIGTLPAKHAMERCDTLLMVGTSFPYPEFLPKSARTRSIQIDQNPARIGLRYPVEIGLVGDSIPILRSLLPLLQRRESRDFIEGLQDEMESWWKQMESQGRKTSLPMKPQVPAWELGKRLNPQAIVTCDSGTATAWLARQIPARGGQLFSLSGALGTMGSGLPYAIAAQIAYPDRQVVAIIGDGSLAMLMAEISTCAKYQLPIKIVVLKNNEFALTHWEQTVLDDHPTFGCELQPIDFVQVAKACGIKSYAISAADHCGKILDQGLNETGPVLFECMIDPAEFPILEF
jgi:pyruvate dehydrogenase (quinone)/pyruvate oxidase